jgi:hypothetical protein
VSNRTRTNQFDREWQFTKFAANEIEAGRSAPEPIKFQTFEVDERSGHEKLVKETTVRPMKITHKGVVYYG